MVATVTALGAAQSTVHYFERDGYYGVPGELAEGRGWKSPGTKE